MPLAARRRSPACASRPTEPPFKSDIRIDYALILIGMVAAVFAFIYLMLV